MFEFDEVDRKTNEAMLEPQVGDRFTEMYTFWVYVVFKSGNFIATLEGNPPITFPDEGKLKTYTPDEFRGRFAYGTKAGCWVRLVDRGNNVEGWYQAVFGQMPYYAGQDSAMAECLEM